TFVMTNIIPQSPSNNREVWRELEEYSRKLAYQGKELYILAGTQGIAKKITASKIVVPKFTWKVILVLDQPHGEITTQNAQAIAVWIPNSEAVSNTDWRDYLTSVDWIEKQTGYNFFADLPKGVQKKLEKTSSLQLR
ncbi:MAG: DNA/RNA non-specific endonuclease, partial [Cyanobacteria bacterium P01_C01_bin.72]